MTKKREAQLQAEIRLAIGRMPDVRLWRNNSGFLDGAITKIRVGLATGSSDLIGILAPSGRFIALEIKTPKGRETEEQKQWQAIIRRFGGFACVVRSVQEAEDAIQRARNGEAL